MIPYSFSVLRYVHDAVTGEFVNVGVALYSGDGSFLKAKCTNQYGRITRMFDRIDGERFKQLVRHIEDATEIIGSKLPQARLFSAGEESMESLLRQVLPPDDSSLQFSPAGFGVSLDLAASLNELYERYVDRYAGQPQDVPSRSDDEVWRVFKEQLEQRNLLRFLGPKRISAPDYDYEFKVGWKNNVWHVYEPVSFDLMEANSLVDKANRWLGRSASLAESPEPFELHLLVGAPRDERLATAFGRAKNILNKISTKHQIVLEQSAPDFAADLERELEFYDGGEQRFLHNSR